MNGRLNIQGTPSPPCVTTIILPWEMFSFPSPMLGIFLLMVKRETGRVVPHGCLCITLYFFHWPATLVSKSPGEKRS
jgi:hypothetical protein